MHLCVFCSAGEDPFFAAGITRKDCFSALDKAREKLISDPGSAGEKLISASGSGLEIEGINTQ